MWVVVVIKMTRPVIVKRHRNARNIIVAPPIKYRDSHGFTRPVVFNPSAAPNNIRMIFSCFSSLFYASDITVVGTSFTGHRR